MGETEEPGRRDTTVTGEYTILVVHQDRVGEAEALDGVRDLADLRTAVGSWVALGRAQVADRTALEVAVLHGHQR